MVTIRPRVEGDRAARRGASLCRAAAAGLLLLAGCGRPADERTADGRLRIHYWEKWTGFEGEAMQVIVDDYNASQDRVFVEKLTVSQIDQKLLLATAGGNPPDLAGLWSQNVNIFAEKGALTPLDRHLAEAGITADRYVPVFWKLCSHRGFVWALPSTPATLALHWNKRLFREAGLDPEKPPASLDELDDMARRITTVEVVRNGTARVVPFLELTVEERQAKRFRLVRLGYSPTWPGWWTPIWGYWFGGVLWDGERAVTAAAPANVEAFRWYASYAETYGLDNLRQFSSSFGNFSSPQNPFLTSQVAMELQGVWMFNFIDKYAPQLEWGVAPFPARDPARFPAVTLAECDVLVIPHGSRHPAEAFDFIRYVNTRSPMEKLCAGQRKFSPLRTVSDEFIGRHPHPYIRAFMDLAASPHAQVVPAVPIWNEYSREMIVAADRIFAGIVTPEEGLGTVQARMQASMDRTQRRWDKVGESRVRQWKGSDAQ